MELTPKRGGLGKHSIRWLGPGIKPTRKVPVRKSWSLGKNQMRILICLHDHNSLHTDSPRISHGNFLKELRRHSIRDFPVVSHSTGGRNGLHNIWRTPLLPISALHASIALCGNNIPETNQGKTVPDVDNEWIWATTAFTKRRSIYLSPGGTPRLR